MGTEKYPDENEYSEFIQNNSGYNNAWTSLTNTNYHFEIANDEFKEALDMFAQFLICPLFGESQIEREMNAVDSEFSMFLNDDQSRKKMIFMMLSHPESQYNRFDVGCLKSLKQEGIRDRLIEFHQKWYSANLMNLVICGNHTLDQLE